MLLKFNKNINKLLLFTVILVIIFIFLGTNIVKLVVNKQFMMEGFENDQPQERIPKVIHQIWIGPREPPTKWINRWKDDYTKMYPDFSHVMWNEEKINKDLNWTPKLRKIYDEEKEMYGKADIARLLILYQYGGIYTDADSIWVNNKNLDEISEKAFQQKTNFFIGKEPNQNFVANGTIGSVKGHPALAFLLNKLEEIADGYSEIRQKSPVWVVTGPQFVNRAVMENYPITVVPEVYFYPYYWHGTKKSDVSLLDKMPPEAYMYHYGYTTNNYLDFK